MGMLAEQADYVVGVDTHRDAHSAAAIAVSTGALLGQATVAADAFGYKRLLRFARQHTKARRVWAIESSGSFGSGLATFLLAHGEWVVEVERPKRPRAPRRREVRRARRDPRRARSTAARVPRSTARPR